jgi:hypothetical protein
VEKSRHQQGLAKVNRSCLAKTDSYQLTKKNYRYDLVISTGCVMPREILPEALQASILDDALDVSICPGYGKFLGASY